MGKGVQTAYTDEYVQLYLLREKEAKNRSLRDLAKEFGVSHGVIQRVLKGKFPKRKDLRRRLYLVPIEEIKACYKCGKILSKYHKCKSDPRPPRISIRLDDPESAARSIEKHMEPELISELIELLK